MKVTDVFVHKTDQFYSIFLQVHGGDWRAGHRLESFARKTVSAFCGQTANPPNASAINGQILWMCYVLVCYDVTNIMV